MRKRVWINRGDLVLFCKWEDMSDDSKCSIIHKYSEDALIEEYKDMEEKFYRLYEDGELPYELYDDDPLVALEEDENGEVANG